MRVLVTRPADDGAEIARKLAAMGHEALVAPLLNVEFQDGAPLALGGVQAILATSANGVRALALRAASRDVPLFAVGPQTAAAARAAGFVRVRSADGNAATLAARTSEWADPGKGALLHAAGEETVGALAEILRARGFEVFQEKLYRIIAATEMPREAAEALYRNRLDAALFFSPRSAEIFAACVRKAGLPTQRLIAVCISENTANALRGLQFSQIRMAARPDQDAMLACL